MTEPELFNTDIPFVSAQYDVSAEQFAHDVYTLCRWMQDNNKHYNLHIETMKIANNQREEQIPFYFLKDREMIELCFEGILYFAESRRRSDFHGWGINKNPILKTQDDSLPEVWAWEKLWLEKFAYLHPDIASDIQSRVDAINAYNDRAPKRKHDNPYLEKLTTVQIAHRRELAQLMSHWMFQLQLAAGLGDDAYRWLQAIWEKQIFIYTSELEYRTAAQPEKRSSKKKTEAARKDFRQSPLYLTKAQQVYSDEFVEMAKNAAFPFDLSVNYDALPKQVPQQAPVMRIGYTDLMHEFIRWVTEAELDPDSFEAEDAHLLKTKLRNTLTDALDDIRKPLARAKGQNLPTEAIDHA